MKKTVQTKILAPLALSLALVGCNHTKAVKHEAPQPVVVTSFNQIDVPFSYGSSTLGQDARALLDDFILNREITSRDDLIIEVSKSENEHSRARIEVVSTYLKNLGLNPKLSHATVNQETLNLQNVTVKVARYSVNVPDCPNWTGDATDGFANGLSSNFGCASATNLALMVADPRDLIRGRDLAPADGAFMANTLGLYQRSEGFFLDSRNLNQTNNSNK